MKHWWLVVAVGCGSVGSEAKMDAPPKQIDAAVDAPPDTRRCDPAKPFGAPVAIAEVNTSSNEAWPSLSADELTIYMHTDRGGAGSTGAYDIFVATRASTSAAFGTPAPVANINTTGDDECPSITADGQFLYVDRFAAGSTGWDIWVAQRASTSVNFSAPTRVDSLNSANAIGDDNQFILPNNSAMYFHSTRNGNDEIFRAARNVGGTFDAATATLIRPASNETSVAVTADELTMYFSSDAAPSTGGQDVWVSKRTTTNDGWGTPVRLTEISTAETDFVSWVSPDGCNLYLSRIVTGKGSDIFVAKKPL